MPSNSNLGENIIHHDAFSFEYLVSSQSAFGTKLSTHPRSFWDSALVPIESYSPFALSGPVMWSVAREKLPRPSESFYVHLRSKAGGNIDCLPKGSGVGLRRAVVGGSGRTRSAATRCELNPALAAAG